MITKRFAGAGMVVLFLLIALPSSGSAYYTDFVFTMMIAYVLAQSWDWIGGEAGYINMAHYVFFGVGAYGFCLSLVAGVPLILCFVIAPIVTIAIAFVLSFPMFRLHGDYFAFATLAMLPLAELLGLNFHFTGGADGVVLPPKYVLFEAYYITVALAVLVVVVTVWLSRLRFGYALRGIRNDEEVAEICGIRIFPAKAKVLVLSAAFASLAGAIFGWKLSFIDPPTVFGLDVALIPVAMALLGGSGLLWGPVVGVLILGSLNQFLVVNIAFLQTAIFGLVLLLIGRYMPGGLLRSSWVNKSRIFGFLGREHHERVLQVDVPEGTDLPLEVRALDTEKPLLECQGMTMAFGGNVAVNDIDLTIRQGEIVGLVGTNGSGKTTLFNLVSKVFEPKSGKILFDGIDLAGLRRDQVSRLGIGRTYQIPRPFEDLTVQENIAIPWMFRDSGATSLSEALARATQFARYAGLEDQLTTRADALNLQQKKALEFARALASRPKLLLIDEVASGLTPAEVSTFVQHIRDMRDQYGVTVIWVEHIFSALAQVVDRVVVMEQGSILADGPLNEVVKDERVLKTYLGSAATGIE
ncbi:MAG: branched-chain amino acid ABC transporter ATP-binding protein/permease [Rhodospirillales bacterium]|nr:branched-chain amino acid ABC transporter ATP-binding protein/permease [Rhodospirillales bacterium]